MFESLPAIYLFFSWQLDPGEEVWENQAVFRQMGGKKQVLMPRCNITS